MFLDIGIGLMVSKILIKTMGFYAPTVFIILGVVFSLLPDIDFIFHLLKKKRLNEYNHKHRDYLHYPILYIGGGFILFLFVL